MNDKKTQWKKVYFPENNVIKETDNAMLIQMPDYEKEYKKYSFWLSKKLINKDEDINENYFVFTENFTFKLKNENDHEITITANDMEKSFFGFNKINNDNELEEEVIEYER